MVPTAQFWHSTRGRLVVLLRRAAHSVGDLAQRLQLTENAIRAHLLTLQRDGLVRLSGQRPGIRRPNYTYELTEEAEQLFPKAYAAVLASMLDALRGRLSAEGRREMLQEVGSRLAEPHLGELSDLPLDARAERVGKLLESMGGSATMAREGDSMQFRGNRCPLSRVIRDADDSDGCVIMQAMLQRLLGVEVTEKCERAGTAKCCFAIADAQGH